MVGAKRGRPRDTTEGQEYNAAQRWSYERSQMGVDLTVREDVGGSQDRRMKVEEPIWNGVVQSRPKLVGEVCMKVHVDMHGGAMVKVEVV